MQSSVSITIDGVPLSRVYETGSNADSTGSIVVSPSRFWCYAGSHDETTGSTIAPMLLEIS
jgi:hypothetical protein